MTLKAQAQPQKYRKKEIENFPWLISRRFFFPGKIILKKKA